MNDVICVRCRQVVISSCAIVVVPIYDATLFFWRSPSEFVAIPFMQGLQSVADIFSLIPFNLHFETVDFADQFIDLSALFSIKLSLFPEWTYNPSVDNAYGTKYRNDCCQQFFESENPLSVHNAHLPLRAKE